MFLAILFLLFSWIKPSGKLLIFLTTLWSIAGAKELSIVIS
jgi:hypothetical protein